MEACGLPAPKQTVVIRSKGVSIPVCHILLGIIDAMPLPIVFAEEFDPWR